MVKCLHEQVLLEKVAVLPPLAVLSHSEVQGLLELKLHSAFCPGPTLVLLPGQE